MKDAVAAQVCSTLGSSGVRRSVQCLGRRAGVQCVEWRTRLLNIDETPRLRGQNGNG